MRFGWLSDIYRWLTLKPYGNTLCAPAARIWIFVARVAVLIMACSEAAAWAYISYWLGTEATRVTVTSSITIAVFLLIVIVDTLFLTFDLRAGNYEKLTGGESHDSTPSAEESQIRRWGLTFVRGLLWIWKTPFPGFLVRLAIVFGSLYVSSPYLSQAVAAKDIAARIERQWEDRKTAKRNEISASYDRRIKALTDAADQLRKESVAESAGAGRSGRRGRGPAVATIEKRLEENEADVDFLTTGKAADLKKFAESSDADLSREYGISPPAGGLQQRSAVMEELRLSPGYNDSQLPIRAYLVGIFLTILLLKLFQPKTVGIYYSERLQSMYEDYKRGDFDRSMAPASKKAGGDVQPLQFEDWYTRTYAARQREEAMRTEMAQAVNHYLVVYERLDEKEKIANGALNPLREDLETVNAEITEIQEQLADIAEPITSLKKSLSSTMALIQEMDKSVAAQRAAPKAVGAEGMHFYMTVLRDRSHYINSVTELEQQLADAELKRSILGEDLKKKEEERLLRQTDLDRKKNYITEIRSQVAEARQEELRALYDIRRKYQAPR
jgi:hypothetical protein